jgi:hypothetical protein
MLRWRIAIEMKLGRGGWKLPDPPRLAGNSPKSGHPLPGATLFNLKQEILLKA